MADPVTQQPSSPTKTTFFKYFLGTRYRLLTAQNVWSYYIDRDNFSCNYVDMVSANNAARQHIRKLAKMRSS